ncbi:ABC transporter substrate-binding protein [Chromobacterium sp. ATCC 53434]|uniref:substrate-binding periplasmic protein n=1 Tax=Chromobacterium sp. (strain ATCC 53434 / SC 14030) TaxID=2059672 RepID=UPI000C75CFC6|nr:ABC transporter substrate-binding protein [Chromobacterium sp. ATCC 53434]AUH49444.1 ABC transporter substrate-binding protein [Chromobacterium sp. ATCC 53434]
MRPLYVLAVWLPGLAAHAATLLGGIAPPYVLSEPPAQGFAVAVMQEAARRLGEPLQISVQPLNRVLTIGSAQARALIVPPCRTPRREALLRWVAPLVDEEFLLIGPAAQPPVGSSPPGGLHIGVVRDSVGLELAKQLPGATIELAGDETLNARKLAAHHIDAWLAAWNSARYAQQQAGLPPDGLRRGQVMLRCTTYLAATRNIPEADLEPWRRAIDEMRRDGSLLKLARRYDLVTPGRQDPPR